MHTIYLFSGLGADERVFKYLEFPGYRTVFIKWIVPIPHEKIEAYALRLTQQIDADNPILIGLSFGGMMAIEVSKLITTEKLIIIASAKTRKELPFYFRFAGKIALHKMMPATFLKWHNTFSNLFFGAATKEDKKILGQILKDTDPVFLKWAIHEIVNWQNDIFPKTLVHVHGNADRVLPLRYVNADVVIENGGHLMTLNKAKELNEVLNRLLK